MADLDRGGFSRRFALERMGPSVGLVPLPTRSSMLITVGGSYFVDLSTTHVAVNVAAAVSITLPSLLDPNVPAIAVPGGYVKATVRIEDIGGHAQAFPITVLTASLSEFIAGATSTTINTNFGSLFLDPNSPTANWIVI